MARRCTANYQPVMLLPGWWIPTEDGPNYADVLKEASDTINKLMGIPPEASKGTFLAPPPLIEIDQPLSVIR